jgi:hypothetical protein
VVWVVSVVGGSLIESRQCTCSVQFRQRALIKQLIHESVVMYPDRPMELLGVISQSEIRERQSQNTDNKENIEIRDECNTAQPPPFPAGVHALCGLSPGCSHNLSPEMRRCALPPRPGLN